MLENFIKFILNIGLWVAIIFIINIIFTKGIIKKVNIFFFIFLLIISFIPLQNSFIKKFSGNLVLDNLDNQKVYDVIILGSNSYRRIDVAIDIVDNLIIKFFKKIIFFNIIFFS